MQKYLRKSNKGFTLIELMIVVAIIGILAAIAIPNFLRFQLRARSSEGKTNIAAIRTAQESYQAEFGNYVVSTSAPSNAVVATKRPWVASTGFTDTGFSPEGQVYFSYAVTSAGTNYTVDAIADIDGDGTDQLWGYLKPSPANVFVDGFNGCIQGATDAPSAQTVGPCGPGSGASVF